MGDERAIDNCQWKSNAAFPCLPVWPSVRLWCWTPNGSAFRSGRWRRSGWPRSCGACVRPWPRPRRRPDAKQKAINERLGKQYGAVFAAHAVLIEDPALSREIEAHIREQHFAAEYAVSRVIRRYAKALGNLERGHLATRSADLFDIERAVLEHLLGQRREQLRNLQQSVVILAHDLTPSETAALDRRMVYAFATEAGGRASHTAIMAAGMEIPAVVGVGKFVTDVSGGDTIVVDGNRGLLILNPDAETLARYEHLRTCFQDFETHSGAAQFAGRNAGSRSGAVAVQHRISLGSGLGPSTAVPPALACTGPSFCTWLANPTRPSRNTSTPT